MKNNDNTHNEEQVFLYKDAEFEVFQPEQDYQIDKILEETHYITEQDAMKKAAEKYGARPQMDEIFSTAEKKVRLFNKNPLDVEDNKPIDETQNGMVDDSTAATMQAQLLMDTPIDSKIPVVNLTPEIPENACVAKDVIEDSPEFDEVNLETGTVFATMEESYRVLNKTSENGSFEQVFGVKNTGSPKEEKTVESKVPVYQQEDDVEKIHLKLGRFSEVVRQEYEQYLRSKNPSISQVIKTEIAKVEELPKKKDNRSVKEKIVSAVVGVFSKDASDDSDVPIEKIITVDDYNDESDVKSIMYELNLNIKKLFVRSFIMTIITFITLITVVLVRAIPGPLLSGIANAPVVYGVINLILTLAVIFINRITIFSGLTPLAKFKGNSDTALAIASIGAGIQSIVSFFSLVGTGGFSVNYYSIVVTVGFLCNCIGKMFMLLRVKDNFKFITAKTPTHAAKIYTNEEIARKMMSGTVVDKPLVAFQHKTKFLSNFLKISYAPDPSEDLAGKIAPATVICSLVVAVIYGVLHETFMGAIDTFAVMTAISIPLCTLLAVNLPMRKMCKDLNESDVMVAGYPSVKQFGDSNAVMIDATDLYPEGSVKLDGIKTFANHRIDESVLAAAAVLKEAKSPMANVFNSAIIQKEHNLIPVVESVLYEDGMGLVGRVKGERILVGNRNLMHKYNIETPSEDYEEKYHIEGRQISYLAQAGELIAMFVTTYTPDKKITEEMQRGELSGLCYLVRTTDCNVTADLIAEDFGIFFRSVKVLPTGLANVCKEAQSQTEEASRAYLGTRGSIASLIRGVSGCVCIKSNISLAVIIQLIAMILGLLLVATLCLYASCNVLGTIEILLYSVFWGLAAIIAPSIRKS